MEKDIPEPVFIDPRYYYLFLALFHKCILEGFDTKSARDYASLELKGKLFHDYSA